MQIPLTIGIFLLFGFNAFCQESHHVTAFIGAPGEVDLLLTYSKYSTDRFWNKEGKSLSTHNHFDRRCYLLYAEYAFNSCNSFTFNGGYSKVKESLNGPCNRLNDVLLGWKHLFRQTCSSALTAQIVGFIPAGKKKSSIRYGAFGVQANLLYSSLFFLGSKKGWYDLGAGYRHYLSFPSDQICMNAAVGCQFDPRLYLIASSRLDYGLFNGKSKHNVNNVAFHPNHRVLNVQLECLIRVFSKISISFGVYKHVWGQNIGIGGGYFCGAWTDF